MYEVSVNIGQILQISYSFEASVHGLPFLCTDAVVFDIGEMFCDSVGTWIGVFLYRRSCGRDPCAKVGFLENGVGRKCWEVFTNTCRNSVKTRNLAFKNFGRKCCKNFADSIAVSEKITTFASQ